MLRMSTCRTARAVSDPTKMQRESATIVRGCDALRGRNSVPPRHVAARTSGNTGTCCGHRNNRVSEAPGIQEHAADSAPEGESSSVMSILALLRLGIGKREGLARNED